MIDFNDMVKRQKEGIALVDSLQQDELMVLQHYSSLSTEALMSLGTQRKASVDQVIINALKHGIALGLRLKVIDGEIHGRE